MIDITRMQLFKNWAVDKITELRFRDERAALQLNLSRGTLADHVNLLRHSSSCNPSARRSPHYSCAYFSHEPNLYNVAFNTIPSTLYEYDA